MGIYVRPDLEGLEPYDPDMRPVRVMLSANENSYGLPTSVKDAIVGRMRDVAANRYPEATCPSLRDLLAAHLHVPRNTIVVGNGGDELIFNLLLAFGGPERSVISCPPTFSAYELYARLTATPVVRVRRDEAFDVDAKELMQVVPGAGLAFITSPNNPTGNLAQPCIITELAQAAPDRLFVVDEAYADFADPASSCIPLVKDFPNVCVLKTLSKAYALAGARVGFIIAREQVCSGLLAVRQPYSVSRYDQAAAEECVRADVLFAPVVEALVRNRQELYEALVRFANDLESQACEQVLQVYPSSANFILVRVDPEAARKAALPRACVLHEALAQDYSILVRNFSTTPYLEGCLRLTVGTRYENALLIAALRELFFLEADLQCSPDSIGNDEAYPGGV